MHIISQNKFKQNSAYSSKPNKNQTLAFKAMKKSQFGGFDLFVVERFKAPIEKFNQKDDFLNWVQTLINKIKQNKFYGRAGIVDEEREYVLKDWINYVTQKNGQFSNSVQLTILSAITKNLKRNNDNVPLDLNKQILSDCIAEIEAKLKEQPKTTFDFYNLYSKKLASFYLKEEKNLSSNKTGWIVIPSKAQDNKNFRTNVKKLKSLSNEKWCIKTFKASSYLNQGKFHLYYEAGQPKIAIRFDNDKIVEIEGFKNNKRIPQEYLETIKKHISENSLKISPYEKNRFDEAELIAKVNYDIGDAIKNNDSYKILDYFKMFPKKNENGKIIIKEYEKTYPLSLSEYGINEENLFNDIVKIEGNADFKGSKLKTLGNLEYIGGDINLNLSKIEDLGALKEIGGNIDFSGSNVKKLGNLEKIGGNAYFYACQIKDLEALKKVEGDIFLDIPVKSLQNLEFIGGNAKINSRQLKDLGKLKIVKGNLNIASDCLQNLGSLEEVWGNATFSKELVNTGNLNRIGGNAHFDETKIKSFTNLKQVFGDLHLEDSNIENLDVLEDVRGEIYLADRIFQDLNSAKKFLEKQNKKNSENNPSKTPKFLEKLIKLIKFK